MMVSLTVNNPLRVNGFAGGGNTYFKFLNNNTTIHYLVLMVLLMVFQETLQYMFMILMILNLVQIVQDI
jgi:hypothetical protein